jgi:hypothetical protein
VGISAPVLILIALLRQGGGGGGGGTLGGLQVGEECSTGSGSIVILSHHQLKLVDLGAPSWAIMVMY